jgi:hypothetical protein
MPLLVKVEAIWLFNRNPMTCGCEGWITADRGKICVARRRRHERRLLVMAGGG